MIVEARLGWKRLRKHMNLRHLPVLVSGGKDGEKVQWGPLVIRKCYKSNHAVMSAYHNRLHEMGNQDHEHE